MRRAVARHALQDRGGAATPTVVVAGVARSGTTWLADVLVAGQRARVMFEPFHARRVEAYRNFEYLQYRRPESDDPALLAFAADVLRGRIRHPAWIDQNAEHAFPRMRVIKDVRICMFLRWLTDRFPDVPTTFIVRHPCAVVASHLGLDWSVDEDYRSILAQPELVEDHLSPHMDWIRELGDKVGQLAAIWAIENLVALRQLEGSKVPVVFYENMVWHPGQALPVLYDAIGQEFDERILGGLNRHSDTVFKGSPLHSGEDPTTAWQRRLTEEQISRVLGIVERFGLEDLYSGPEPAFGPTEIHSVKIQGEPGSGSVA
jgi:hypothetical protein